MDRGSNKNNREHKVALGINLSAANYCAAINKD